MRYYFGKIQEGKDAPVIMGLLIELSDDDLGEMVKKRPSIEHIVDENGVVKMVFCVYPAGCGIDRKILKVKDDERGNDND